MAKRENLSRRKSAHPAAKEADIRVGAKIRAYRLKKGLSLTTLSELTGIAASNLSSIELDKTSPTLATLVKIATAFRVRVGAFLDGALYRKAVYCPKEEAEQQGDLDAAVSVHRLTGGVSLNDIDARLMSIAGPCPPFSVHPRGTDRFLYCLTGVVKVRVDDETYELRSGDGLYLLPEASAEFLADDRNPASILVVGTSESGRFA